MKVPDRGPSFGPIGLTKIVYKSKIFFLRILVRRKNFGIPCTFHENFGVPSKFHERFGVPCKFRELGMGMTYGYDVSFEFGDMPTYSEDAWEAAPRISKLQTLGWQILVVFARGATDGHGTADGRSLFQRPFLGHLLTHSRAIVLASRILEETSAKVQRCDWFVFLKILLARTVCRHSKH